MGLHIDKTSLFESVGEHCQILKILHISGCSMASTLGGHWSKFWGGGGKTYLGLPRQIFFGGGGGGGHGPLGQPPPPT